MNRLRLSTRTTASRRAGLTIVELLLALAGTGFIASAIVVMLNAVATGTHSRSDLRQSVVRHKTLTARLTAAVRESYMVLAAGDDLLVLWTGDENSSQTPNLSEIRRIERDTATGELRAYAAPVDLAEDADTDFGLEEDFAAVTAALKGSANFTQEIWATGVRSWSLSLNDAQPQVATLISSRMTILTGQAEEAIICAAALRNAGSASFTAGDDESSSSGGSGGDGGGHSAGDDQHMSGGDSGITEDDGKSGSGGSGGSGGGKSDDDDDDDSGSGGKGKGKGKGKSKGHDDDDDDDDDDHGKGKGKGDEKVDGDDKNKGKGNG